MVFGCLVGWSCPLGLSGLAPAVGLPAGLAGSAVPRHGAPVAGCSGGSSPGRGPLAAAGHAFPSPRPVPEAAPPDHHGGGVMAADGDRSLMLKRGEPVLRRPPGGAGGVDGDHRESRVEGHLGEPVPEPGRGDAGHQCPEPPTAAAARRAVPGTFPAQGPGLGEVQVLDHDRACPVLPGCADQGGDGGPDAAVPLAGGQPGQGKGDRDREADGVPVGGERPGGEVPGVHVDRDHRVRAEFCEVRGGAGRRLPARVQVPAPGARVQADVVADRPGRGLRRDLITPVGENDRARQAVPRASRAFSTCSRRCLPNPSARVA